MKSRNLIRLTITLLFGSILILGGYEAQAGTLANGGGGGSTTRLVDDDKVQCPTAQFTSIQAAVSAAGSGDIIKVCPGTYQEQVRINKPLTVQGIAVGNLNLILIKPAPAIVNSASITNPTSLIAAIVLVENASNVNLINLTVDGATNGNVCGTNIVGIYYRNASGKADSVAVRNIRLVAGNEGCQSGLGIFAQSGGGGSSKLQVLNSSVHDYQKNGITGNETGTELTAIGNNVSGDGATPFIAQNGIQVANGAKGFITGNSVINNDYAGCTSPDTCAATASNILVFNASYANVSLNSLGKSQINIFLQANKSEASYNNILDSDVFDGIDIFGNQNKVNGNRIFNSDTSGIFVEGNQNEVKGNTINEAPVGILEDTPSSGNSYSDNKYFNTGFNFIHGSAPPSLTMLSAPQGGRSVSPAQP
ncbi:MAG: right-handed parallel beta-helix repeat-containing protein [Pyrinomonadaceae bacterium]